MKISLVNKLIGYLRDELWNEGIISSFCIPPNVTKFTVSLKSLSSFLLGLRIDFLLALPVALTNSRSGLFYKKK